jgi:hypothetical protein
MLAIAGNLYEENFIPTDIKSIGSNQNAKLVAASGANPIILTVIKRKDHPDNVDGVSTAISPAVSKNLNTHELAFEDSPNGNIEGAPVQPTMISLMDYPIVSTNSVKIKLPVLPKTLIATGTYAVLSDVKVKTSGEFKAEVADPRWEIFAPVWISDFNLPVLPSQYDIENIKQFESSALAPGEVEANQQLRWDVTVLARTNLDNNNKKRIDLGPSLFKDSTHATRSTQIFQAK